MLHEVPGTSTLRATQARRRRSPARLRLAGWALIAASLASGVLSPAATGAVLAPPASSTSTSSSSSSTTTLAVPAPATTTTAAPTTTLPPATSSSTTQGPPPVPASTPTAQPPISVPPGEPTTSTTHTAAATTTTTILPALRDDAAPEPGDDARPPATREPLTAAAPAPGRLSRLLEDARARRARLGLAVAKAEQALAGLESERAAAQAVVDAAATGHGELAAQRARLLDDLAKAEGDARAAQAQLAAVAAIGATTPMAYPPAEGATPAARRAQARQAALGALRRTSELTVLLDRQLPALRLAGEQARAAAAKVQALAEHVRAAGDGLAALRREMAAVADDLTASTGLTDALAAGAEPSALAVADIPPPMLELYRRAAAACPGLPWTVLAAIGSVETSHGRVDLPGVRTGANPAGAMGPMQFLEATWAAHGTDADDDGRRDVYSAADAVFGAANYLCASGGGRPSGLAAAIWAYNHADWYVEAVLEVAAGYGAVGLVADQAATAALLAAPNLTLSPEARADIAGGLVDSRLVTLLAAASVDHAIAVSVIRTGHAQYVDGTDRISNHYFGRGVDIYAVDGAPVSASNEAAFGLALAVLASGPDIRPHELGSPWTSLGAFAGAFSDEAHADHLHLGWPPKAPEFHQVKDSGQ